MSNELAETNVQELVKLAREGDQIALGELAYHASRVLKPIDPYSGDLARTIVEPMLISLVAEKYNPFQNAVAAKLQALRRDLSPPRFLNGWRCWLRHRHSASSRATAGEGRTGIVQNFEAGHNADYRKITMVDQSLSRAGSVRAIPHCSGQDSTTRNFRWSSIKLTWRRSTAEVLSDA